MKPAERERAISRVRHMLNAIRMIRELLEGHSEESLARDHVAVAAPERFFERLSEASRHVPKEWQGRSGAQVQWRQLADLGNPIRHEYDDVDTGILWAAYRERLDSLEAALDAMLREHRGDM
jgi:uncharacterized protein with HEPN domain